MEGVANAVRQKKSYRMERKKTAMAQKWQKICTDPKESAVTNREAAGSGIQLHGRFYKLEHNIQGLLNFRVNSRLAWALVRPCPKIRTNEGARDGYSSGVKG